MASYHSHCAAAAFPESESRPEPEARELHLFSFYALTCLVRVFDRQYYNRQTNTNTTAFCVCKDSQRKGTNTHTKVNRVVTGNGAQNP